MMFSRGVVTQTLGGLRSAIFLRNFGKSASKLDVPSFDSLSQNLNPVNLSAPRTENKAGTENLVKYILHCNFTKNNTHLTLTGVYENPNYAEENPGLSFNEHALYYLRLPERPILSLSTGCVGFRKSARGEYEAAFQTTSKMFSLMKEKNILNTTHNIEIVLKNFGKGREAFLNVLQGKEGLGIKNKIKRISDNSKIKFGGVRSPAIRRL